jgi:hypothetical protein
VLTNTRNVEVTGNTFTHLGGAGIDLYRGPTAGPIQGAQADLVKGNEFTDVAAKVCPSCTIVVADMLDQADDPSAKKPTFKNTTKFIKTFRKALKTKRNVCGIHNYSDVNRFRTTGTKALMSALGCKQYWLTETGGLYKFGSFWSKKTYKGCKSASSCQLKATKYLFSTASKDKKIKRIYVYTWFGAVTPRFDAGLVANGAARPAYDEVAKHVQ